MPRPSMLIMRATLSTNSSSGPIVFGDWCDRQLLYQVEASSHLPTQGDRSQDQDEGDDPGVVGSRHQGQSQPPGGTAGPSADSRKAVFGMESNRRFVSGRARQSTTHRKESHLASLLPSANGASCSSP